MQETLEGTERPFRFKNARQSTIYENLLLIGPGSAAFYKDACWLIENEGALSSASHLIGHLLREIESALRSVLIPVAESTTSAEKENNHKQQIQMILADLEIDDSDPVAKAWYKLSESLYGIAHRNALKEPRPVDKKLMDLWANADDFLFILLQGFRRQFFKRFNVLDELLKNDHPDVSILSNKVPQNLITIGYFFDRLENPDWIEPLWKKGYFHNPPSLERDEEKGTTRYPAWLESRFLSRMASKKPDTVLKIILQIPATENVRVYADFAEAALNMPSDIAVQLIEKAKVWARSPYLTILPVKIGALAAHLAEGGKVEEALDLSRTLLEILPGERADEVVLEDWNWPSPEPIAHFDKWEYEEILEKHFPILVRAAGVQALSLLCDLLEKAIRLSRRSSEENDQEDHSCIWRTAVEDHPENLGHNLKETLVTAIRDTAESLLDAKRATIQELVDSLEKKPWKIFRRIALHLLRRFPEQAHIIAAAHLTKREHFDDSGVQHEFVLLLRAYFNHLTAEQQQTILGWIKAGPDLEKYIISRTGEVPTEDEKNRFIEVWQRDRLSWIGLNLLPEEWKGRCQSLVEKYGAKEHPEFPFYAGSWEGPTSPKSAEELQAMSVAEIVDFLNAWNSGESIFGEPSPEGMGRTLSSVVAQDPERFASEASEFEDLDPTFIRAILSGFAEGIKQGRAFDWRPVLQLCQWVLVQADDTPDHQAEIRDKDPDWKWTRKTIAGLLSALLESASGTLHFGQRVTMWRILEALANDPDPTPAYEAQYGGSNMDPATLSINTIRGEAMHALVHYALWVRSHQEKQHDAEERLKRGFQEMPEVREVLDRHLDTTNDASLAIRSIYGQWFPWLTLLDPDWARDHVDQIFPLDESQQTYFESAWITYINFCQPYDNVFELLHKCYQHGVERIDKPNGNRRLLANPDQRLAEHLMVFFWRGKLLLIDPLFQHFWEKASDGLRAHAFSNVGQALEHTKGEVAPEILNRLKSLWSERLAICEKAADGEKHKEEMAAFGWWLISRKLDIPWVITQLIRALKISGKIENDRKVMEYLVEQASEYPEESVQCLQLMAEGDLQGWRIYHWQEQAKNLLSIVLQKSEDREQAASLVNYLGSRGFREFRDLLKI